ncbi:uncharacterized protein LOC113472504 [Diaphorina citri]|uniref:Uncharacterized protein LOC113472504 n=1 Tax=Diaphorina citri TaxID=121845 RepID=A0A3Q0JLP9_DIACI|nr:uncharacterized protein LOC113472504 [Diaphorina citri]
MAENFDAEIEGIEFLEDLDRNDHQRYRYEERGENDYDTMDDRSFITRYRLSRAVVYKLLQVIGVALQFESGRNNPLSPMLQLLIALRYYATGSFRKQLKIMILSFK